MQREFQRGDVVRMRSTPDVAGQVVGEEDWGARYAVRLAGSLDVEWFENVEIEAVPVKAVKADVIDFTKARDLRATKTRGVA